MTTSRSDHEWKAVLRRQAAVARLGQLGLQAVEVDELFGQAIAAVAETLGVAHVVLAELFPERGVLEGRSVAYEGIVLEREAAAYLRLPTGRGSMPGYALLEGRAVVTSDLLSDQRFITLAPSLGIAANAAISAPIGWAGDHWGVLSAYDVTQRRWTDEEVDFVCSVANTLGMAIQRHDVEQDLRAANIRLDLSLAAGGLGSWSWSESGRQVWLSSSALELHGTDAESFPGTPAAYAELVHPEDRETLLAAVAEVLEGRPEMDETFRIIRPDGGPVRWIRAWGRQAQEPGKPRHLVGVLADVTDQVADEQRLEATLVAEKMARRRAELAGARLATLSEASTVFSQSLEPDVILDALADFCVPLLADVCRVDTVDDAGRLVPRALRAVDDEKREAFTALGEYHEMHPVASTASYSAIRADDLELVATDPGHLAALRRLGPTTVVEAPLIARDEVIGRLTLVETGDHRRHSPDHVAMIEDLASRAALALDNGRLHQSRTRMVDSLQAALAPRELPDPDGLSFAARYRVAAPHDDVGGDFYDVFEITDDRWGVVVGDVCGHGPDAAALTGLVRHSIRAAVVRDDSPLQVLSQTNDAVLNQLDDFRFCSATYMRVQRSPEGAQLVISSAGHPRPVVVRAGGGAEPIACSGVVLGVVRNPRLVEMKIDLEPGDAVVLYTDGITEARGVDGLFGDDRLVEVLERAAGGTAEEIASALDDAVRVHRSGADDDLAILVVQADRH